MTIGEPTSYDPTVSGPFGDLNRALTDDINRFLQQTQLPPGKKGVKLKLCVCCEKSALFVKIESSVFVYFTVVSFTLWTLLKLHLS